jgi:hypothetical protein
MSEEQRGGPIEVPREPERLPELREIEKRLSLAASPEEALKWVQVMGEIQQQDAVIQEGELRRQLVLQRHRDMLEEAKHRRFLGKAAYLGKMGLSFAVIGIGTGLVVGGFQSVGFFTLGAGLYWLAPEWVRTFSPPGGQRRRREEGDDE